MNRKLTWYLLGSVVGTGAIYAFVHFNDNTRNPGTREAGMKILDFLEPK